MEMKIDSGLVEEEASAIPVQNSKNQLGKELSTYRDSRQKQFLILYIL